MLLGTITICFSTSSLTMFDLCTIPQWLYMIYSHNVSNFCSHSKCFVLLFEVILAFLSFYALPLSPFPSTHPLPYSLSSFFLSLCRFYIIFLTHLLPFPTCFNLFLGPHSLKPLILSFLAQNFYPYFLTHFLIFGMGSSSLSSHLLM